MFFKVYDFTFCIFYLVRNSILLSLPSLTWKNTEFAMTLKNFGLKNFYYCYHIVEKFVKSSFIQNGAHRIDGRLQKRPFSIVYSVNNTQCIFSSPNVLQKIPGHNIHCTTTHCAAHSGPENLKKSRSKKIREVK